tara:strand:- start:923 stop:1072 length:150 start_codon:yes stop_codon:yes gene_type:complete
MSTLMKISKFTDDQSDQVIACGKNVALPVGGIIPKKILPVKTVIRTANF